MTRLALSALTAFLVTVGPVDTAAVFAGLTRHQDARTRRRTAVRGTLIATGVLLLFTLLGDDLLRLLDIRLAAVRVGGGLLLLLFSIQVVFGHETEPERIPDPSPPRSRHRDITVFPLAMPLIASPGAITAAVVLSHGVHNQVRETAVVVGVMLLVLGLTLLCLLGSARLERVLGQTGMSVLTRVFGFLLTAMAAELILDGLVESLFRRP
jgi:multiple antibiotic resistance protein